MAQAATSSNFIDIDFSGALYQNGVTRIDASGNLTVNGETMTGNTIIGDAISDTLTINATTTIPVNTPIQFVNTASYINSSSTGTINVVGGSNVNLTVGGNSITVSGSGLTGAITELLTQTETTATPGTVRTITGKITSFSTLTSGTLVGVRGEANIPNSGSISTGTFMYGTQGKLICGTGTTIDAGSGHVTGVLGQLDISTCTTTSGHIAPVISSIQDSSGTARPYVNGFYAELPAYGSGALMNSVLQGVGAANYGLDLGGIGGMTKFVALPSSVAGAVDGSGSAVYIDILINGVAARLTAKYVA